MQRERVRDVPIPPELDTPEFRQAWAELIDYRARWRKPPLKPKGARRSLEILAEYGPEIAVVAIDNSIGKCCCSPRWFGYAHKLG